MNGAPEFDAWASFFAGEPLRLIDVDALCTAGMPDAVPCSFTDYQNGNYIPKLWVYAYCMMVYEWCQETPP